MHGQHQEHGCVHPGLQPLVAVGYEYLDRHGPGRGVHCLAQATDAAWERVVGQRVGENLRLGSGRDQRHVLLQHVYHHFDVVEVHQSKQGRATGGHDRARVEKTLSHRARERRGHTGVAQPGLRGLVGCLRDLHQLLGILEVLLGSQLLLHQLLLPVVVGLGRKVSRGSLLGVLLKLCRVNLGKHLALGHLLTHRDMDLLQRAADLRDHGRLMHRHDVAGQPQCRDYGVAPGQFYLYYRNALVSRPGGGAARGNARDRSPDENQDDGDYRQMRPLYLHRLLFRNGNRDLHPIVCRHR